MLDRAIHRNDLSAMPTVGAGSSQRKDSPAHLLPAHTIQDLGKNDINDAARVELRRGINNCDAARRVATNAAAAHGDNGRGNLRADREDPAPYSRRLRGYHCVSHCEPHVAITAASMRIPRHP